MRLDDDLTLNESREPVLVVPRDYRSRGMEGCAPSLPLTYLDYLDNRDKRSSVIRRGAEQFVFVSDLAGD